MSLDRGARVKVYYSTTWVGTVWLLDGDLRLWTIGGRKPTPHDMQDPKFDVQKVLDEFIIAVRRLKKTGFDYLNS